MEMLQTKRQENFELLYKDFSSEILGLQGVIITAVDERNGQLYICVELSKNGHTCPSCGAKTKIIRTAPLSQYRKAPNPVAGWGQGIRTYFATFSM